MTTSADQDQARRRRLLRLGAVLAAAAVVVLVAIVVSSSGGADTAAKPVRKAGEVVPGQRLSREELAGIPQHGITLGRPDAPVTLVEFADLKCPVCREYSATELPRYLETYVRTGKVKLQFRVVDIIGGEDSNRAAQMAAAAAQQDKLWNFADLFYRNQGDESVQYVDDAFLTRIGRGVAGLDVDRALAARAAAPVTDLLAQSRTLLSRYAVNSTPTFLVGRDAQDLHPVGDDVGYDALGPVIDAELAKVS